MLNSRKVRFEYSTNGSNPAGSDFNTVLATSTWYHVAVVRNGTTIKCYIDGTAEATTINISTNTIYNSTADVYIGFLANSEHYFYGNLDEIRVLKGVAAWTGNFTIPSAEYSETYDCISSTTCGEPTSGDSGKIQRFFLVF